MRVHISQGHEKGIGLEVLFKTALLLSGAELAKLQLYAFRDAVELTLKSLRLPFSITPTTLELCGQSLPTTWLKTVDHSQSHTSLVAAMKGAETSGILYTLPTSKDQFKKAAGHTEYFRRHYALPDLGMFFSSPDLRVLLLTDHVSIKELPEILSKDMVYRKLRMNLNALRSWHFPLDRILISGLNPHAGESGMLGKEESRIHSAIERLRNKDSFAVSGPFPGDTMLLEKRSRSDLLIYLFHDQGLGVFKGQQGFIGSNITLGLPYLRVSPDHGTSFALFGKNQADHRGCAFSLREALSMLARISHGKNPGHQGQGSQP